MKRGVQVLMVLAMLPLAAAAQAVKDEAPPKLTAEERAHRAADIARHRQMATAHEQAARCLEAGNPEKQCQQRLREACKGIAVGQYCGMRHAH